MKSDLLLSGLVLAVSAFAIACGDDGAPGGQGGQTTTGATKASGATTTATTATGASNTTTAATTTSGSTTATTTTATTASSSATGMLLAPECTQDADCFVNDDCCECAGRVVGEQPPACNVDCTVTVCDQAGVPVSPAVCRAGRCVSPIDCAVGPVVCDIVPPVCPPGTAAAMNAQGNCWVLPAVCIPVTECISVTACDSCGTDFCIEQVAFMPTTHCVSPIPGCAPDDCECVGPSTCVDPFTACGESDGHVTCTCITC